MVRTAGQTRGKEKGIRGNMVLSRAVWIRSASLVLPDSLDKTGEAGRSGPVACVSNQTPRGKESTATKQTSPKHEQGVSLLVLPAGRKIILPEKNYCPGIGGGGAGTGSC
jgi:hypothetical protein